ncbi:MAG: hypothetical protein ABI559_12430 [Chloroflexota bacterium]
MNGIRTWRALPLGIAIAAIGALFAITGAPVHAADPAPELVFQYPPDGAVVNQPVFGYQLCFKSPINKNDLPTGGDFSFSVTAPDGLGLGHRDVFQPDAFGITIYPGKPVGETIGPWKFHWRVTSPDAASALEGDINVTVDPSGTANPQATPPPCIGEGGTATVSPTPLGGGSVTPTNDPKTSASAAVTAVPSTTPKASPVVEDGDDQEIGKYAFLTIGAAGVAAVVLLIGYFIRKRIGYDPHKPTGDDGGHH